MATSVIDENGKIGDWRGGGGGPTVVAVGATGSAKSSLVNSIFGTRFKVGRTGFEHTTLGAPAETAQFANLDVTVVDVEGSDSSDERRFNLQARAMLTSLSVADIVLFNCLFHDLTRDIPLALSALSIGVSELQRMRAKKILPATERKTPLVLAVRDFDLDEDMDEAQIKKGIVEQLPAEISSYYDVTVATVRSRKVEAGQYGTDVYHLRSRLRTIVSDTRFKAVSRDTLTGVYDHIVKDETAVPSEDELRSSFISDTAALHALDVLEETTQKWTDEVENGEIFEEAFGSMCTELLDETLKLFESEAGTRKSATSQRKVNELRAEARRQFDDLYTKQLRRLAEREFDRFRSRLQSIGFRENLDKQVDSLVAEVKKSFANKANKMRPPASKVKIDSSRKELHTNLKELSSSHLQLAQFSGVYTPQKREPIRLSIHYLHPNPFFKDSKSEPLTRADQPSFDVNKMRNKDVIGESLRGPFVRKSSSNFEDAIEMLYVDGDGEL